MPETGDPPDASTLGAGLEDIRAALASQLAGAVDQANTGGTNVANSGVIERLTITLGAQPDVPPIGVFVVCSGDDSRFVETEVLPALDPLPLRIRYAVNTAGDPDAWEPIYRAMDRANLLLVAASRPVALRDPFVRNQVAYWLDSHPDTASVLVVTRQGNQPRLVDERLTRHPVVTWSEDAASGSGAHLVRAVRHATPVTPLAEAGAGVTELRSLAPVRSAYLRWLRRRHSTLEAVIAGRTVVRPLQTCPPPGNLVSDESHERARLAELAHLYARTAGREADLDGAAGHEAAELSILADRPLPTYLGATTHLDHLDLAGRPVTSPRRLLAEVWRAIVLGDPGSGKSSLVRRLVSDLADDQGDDPGEPGADGTDEAVVRRLPVLCRAADLITALSDGTPSAEALAAAAIGLGWAGQPPLDPDSGDPIPQPDLARLARAAVRDRRLLLVVDGLDEVPTQGERRALAAALDHFATAGGARIDRPERAPGNQMLVTSRIAGYHSSPLGDRFGQFLIGPLEPAAATAIVDYWLTEDPDVPPEGALPGDAAAQRVRVNDLVRRPSLPVGEFATNPYLLVSLISASFAGWGSGHRPDGHRWVRADLYHLMVDDAVRRGLQRYPGVDPGFALRLQCALAHRIHQRSQSGVVERDLLDSFVTEVLAELSPAGDSWTAATARQLVADIGLLIDRGQGLFGFRHLTVEEYLAARWLLIRQPDPARVAGSMTTHLSDPRWLEVLRLALGELSSTDRSGFDAVVRAMLGGPTRRSAAELLATCLADLVTLAPQHVELLVAITVESEEAQQGSAAFTDAVLLAPLLNWSVSIERRSCAGYVREALIRFVTGDKPGTAAAAARLIEAAQIDDRKVAEALFDMRERDGPAYGWQLTRSLMSVQTRRLSTDSPSPRTPALAEADRDWLAAQEFTLPPPEAPRPRSALRGAGGLGNRLPMRNALELDPALVEQLLADRVWIRAFLCLYGGIPFLDARRWQDAHREIAAAFEAPTTGRVERRRLAIMLDTVVAPALAARSDQSVGFSVAHIAGESPLTPRLVALLADRVDGAKLTDALVHWSTEPGLDIAARGDALAACLAATAGSDRPDVGAYEDAVRERAGWRLGQAEVLFTDALARLSPDIVITSAGSDSGDLAGDVIRAMHRLDHHPHSWGGDDVPERIDHFLGVLACGPDADKAYRLVVTLDTCGRAIGGDPLLLIQRLCRLHLSPAFTGQLGADWPVDPFAPAVPDLGEALSALWDIDPRWAFLRCWLIDRLAGVFVANGYAAEASHCAADVAGSDRVSALRTVLRIDQANRRHLAGATSPDATTGGPNIAGQEDLVDAGALSTELLRLVDDAGFLYPRVRARLWREARLGASWGIERLVELVAAIDVPWYRMRVLELAVELHLVSRSDALLELATETARLIDVPIEQARALARLSRWTTGQRAEDLRVEAVTATYGADSEQAALLLAAIGPTIVSADGEAAWRQYVDALHEPWQRSLATADTASLLLRHETAPGPESGDQVEPTGAGLLPWAVLSGATLCRSGIESLRRTGGAVLSEARAWSALVDPDRRDAAMAVLREVAGRRGGVTPHQLTDTASAGIDALVNGGFDAYATELLLSCAYAGRDERLHVWRAYDGLVGEVATLLLIESGRLDRTAIGRLESLLTHRDDRIRLRTRLALAPINNGTTGAPWLRASALGPDALTELVRLTVNFRTHHPEFCTDLGWAVSEIVHDSESVLATTLAALADDDTARQVMLSRFSRPSKHLLDRLENLLATVSEDDACHLLYGLQAAGAHPGHFGVRPDQLQRVVPAVRRLLYASGTAVGRDCLRLLGHVLPVEPASVRLLLDEALADEEVAAAACEAVGFLVMRRPSADEWRFDARDHADLARLAVGPDTDVAAAALGALAHGGVVIESLQHIPPWTVARGLMTTADPYLVGDRFRHAVRRARRYVLSEPHHDDRRSLVERIVDDVVAWLADYLERRRTGARPHPWPTEQLIMPPDVPLQVLTDIAQQQPAAVREAVRVRAPHLPDLLVEVIEIDPSWTSRLAAGVLLLCLGRGDGPRLRAVVRLARDSSVVHRAVLSAVRWLDGVTDDGITELVAATGSDFLPEAHLAVEILGSVAHSAGLAPARRRAVLDAITAAMRRADADRQIQLVHNGRVESVGTFTATCRRILSVLRDSRSAVAAAAHVPHVLLHLRDAHGRPVSVAVTAGVPTPEPIKHQAYHLQETELVELVQEDLDRLNRVCGEVASTGTPLASLLRELQP